MKGDAEIIKHLNIVLYNELTAINQYFLHARMCKDWGYHRIGDIIMKESIDEMKHAQKLTDRILFLEGIPNLQKLGTLNIGETIPEMLDSDLKLEGINIPVLRDGIKMCFEKADHVTRELFEYILEDEEKHVDWLESQLKLISDMGVQNYLAEQMGEETN